MGREALVKETHYNRHLPFGLKVWWSSRMRDHIPITLRKPRSAISPLALKTENVFTAVRKIITETYISWKSEHFKNAVLVSWARRNEWKTKTVCRTSAGSKMILMSWLAQEGLNVSRLKPLRRLEKWAGSRGKEAGGERKKERKRTDACDLCLTPWGISATDNLIEAGA